MYSKYKSSILILLVLMVQYSYGERTKLPRFGNKTVLAAGTHIELSAVKCTHTVPEIVEYLQCLLIRRNSSSYITIRLLLRQSVARFDTNAVLDILGKNHSIYVINHVYKLVYAAINETVTCPLKAHYNYTVTELDVSQIKLPNYIPRAKFRLSIYIRTDGRRSADVVINGRIGHSKE